MNKEELREKIREEREKEWLRGAIRARKISNINTFEQGLSLIEFARKVAENDFFAHEEDIQRALKENSHATIEDKTSMIRLDIKGIW